MSHGFVAVWLGDPTPKHQKRLSLNPIHHLELFGSIILPALCYFLGGFMFGWAKPVMINPYNLKFGKWGEVLVAIAGPISNIVLAIIFGMIIRFHVVLGLSTGFIFICTKIVSLNLILAIFNCIPIPPLDGSKVLFAILPQRLQSLRHWMEANTLIVFVFLILFLDTIFAYIIIPILNVLASLIVGI
jgi:Zn-dependent protease